MSKTYTIAVTKTIVVGTPAESMEHARKNVEHALKEGAYTLQWQQAINKLDLIAVE